MNILYLGDAKANTTSKHRADALTRLGHTVNILDPYKAFNSIYHPIWGRIHFHTGYRFLQKKVLHWIHQLKDGYSSVDLIWVNGGELFGKDCVRLLKTFGCPVALYNNDDPTGGRDGHRFDSLLKAIPEYDLCAVMRYVNVAEYYSLKAKNVLQVTMSYDEIIHKPFEHESQIADALKSEVAFIGTWMRNENRDVFLLDLIKRGVPVSIWGARWKKSAHWDALKHAYKGEALNGREYVQAVQGAKICLGLLSKGNRDTYTTRSLEVPYSMGLLCAERTVDHLNMYVEGEEAVFWSDSAECSTICLELLKDDSKIQAIKIAGHQRVLKNRVGNEDICKKIIDSLSSITHHS